MDSTSSFWMMLVCSRIFVTLPRKFSECFSCNFKSAYTVYVTWLCPTRVLVRCCVILWVAWVSSWLSECHLNLKAHKYRCRWPHMLSVQLFVQLEQLCTMAAQRFTPQTLASYEQPSLASCHSCTTLTWSSEWLKRTSPPYVLLSSCDSQPALLHSHTIWPSHNIDKSCTDVDDHTCWVCM